MTAEKFHLKRDEMKNKSIFKLCALYTSTQDNQLKPSTQYQEKPGTATEIHGFGKVCSPAYFAKSPTNPNPISWPQAAFPSH